MPPPRLGLLRLRSVSVTAAKRIEAPCPGLPSQEHSGSPMWEGEPWDRRWCTSWKPPLRRWWNGAAVNERNERLERQEAKSVACILSVFSWLSVPVVIMCKNSTFLCPPICRDRLRWITNFSTRGTPGPCQTALTSELNFSLS